VVKGNVPAILYLERKVEFGWGGGFLVLLCPACLRVLCEDLKKLLVNFCTPVLHCYACTVLPREERAWQLEEIERDHATVCQDGGELTFTLSRLSLTWLPPPPGCGRVWQVTCPREKSITMSVTAYYTKGEIPQLSTTRTDEVYACKIKYLNEGGANFIFSILQAGTELPTSLRGKLLRLRKDLSHVQTTTEQVESFNANFRPLFPPDCLVQPELVRLNDGMAEALNRALDTLNRPSRRDQDFLPRDERYGLLVTDMRPAAGKAMLEIKPKWLLQSPNAPSNAKRCRTCALRAQRATQGKRTATDEQSSCPLDLVSERKEDRQRAARKATRETKLADFLADGAQPLFAILRDQQKFLDPRGVLRVSGAEDIYDLCRAMTLRDCTLFVRAGEDGIEARLGDLDFKQPEKLKRWKEVERQLIDDGWYVNTEAESMWCEETICRLSRNT
jgi:inositol-pentakisphosphate 2-kinase